MLHFEDKHGNVFDVLSHGGRYFGRSRGPIASPLHRKVWKRRKRETKTQFHNRITGLVRADLAIRTARYVRSQSPRRNPRGTRSWVSAAGRTPNRHRTSPVDFRTGIRTRKARAKGQPLVGKASA